MGPPVNFGLPVLILRVIEAWEPGKMGLYRKYRSYKKIMKISKFYFGLGTRVRKTDVYAFSGFTRKIRNTGISSETTMGISSETTIPGISSEPGFRRLTRDSRNRRLTRDSRIPDFSHKKFWKNPIFFSDSQDQKKNLKFS